MATPGETPGEALMSMPEEPKSFAITSKLGCAILHGVTSLAAILIAIFAAVCGQFLDSTHTFDLSTSFRTNSTGFYDKFDNNYIIPGIVLSRSFANGWVIPYYTVIIAVAVGSGLLAIGLCIDWLGMWRKNGFTRIEVSYNNVNTFAWLYRTVVDIVVWQLISLYAGVADLLAFIAISGLVFAWDYLFWQSFFLNSMQQKALRRAALKTISSFDESKDKVKPYIWSGVAALIPAVTASLIVLLAVIYKIANTTNSIVGCWGIGIIGLVLYLVYAGFALFYPLLGGGNKWDSDRNLTLLHGGVAAYVFLFALINGLVDGFW